MENKKTVIGSSLYIVDEIDSTNTALLKNADLYEHGTILCAKKQTAGRGRNKRNWRSQNGGLYFSILLKDQKDILSLYQMVLLSALSVARCIQSFACRGVAIKWPNDIYINHRKVCGILAESATCGKRTDIVIGVGLNVNNTVSHLNGLRHPAVSLREFSGEKTDLDDLLQRIINELNLLYADYFNNKFSNHLKELNRFLYSKGQETELFIGHSIRMITPLAFTEKATLRCLENNKETEIYLGEM